MVACTWNIITLEGHDEIQDLLNWPSFSMPTAMQVSQHPVDSKRFSDDIVEGWCDMETKVGTGKAFIRLEQTADGRGKGWKAQRILTVLMELKGHPFRVGDNRIRGVVHGPVLDRSYWSDIQQPKLEHDTIIIGGGQAGLALGARLQLLGDVDYTVLEAADRPGSAWHKRYPSLRLHDPVWYNHMPYLPFPPSWPIFCPRDKIASWMELYAEAMDVNIQTRTKVIAVRNVAEDDAGGSNAWEVDIEIRNENGNIIDEPPIGNVRRTLRARNVVFATGNSSKPKMPEFIGANTFRGTILHSSKYRGGGNYKGKQVVVVGANNSALDICQDLWEQGAKSVTMIQRSPSLVVSTEAVLERGLGPLYNEHPILHHEDADLVATSMPYKMLLERWSVVTNQMRDTDRVMHEGLAKAGYELDFGPDGTGLFAKSATEGGGFYINMGAAELIIQGQIQTVYGTVRRIGEHDVVVVKPLSERDDISIPADVIVYATGFETLDEWVADICGEEIANAVGRTWGLGWGRRPHKDPGPWQGELRNMWKPTQVAGLWFQGGNLAQNRHYSRFLALQLAARSYEIATPVYGIPNATAPSNNILEPSAAVQ